MISHWLWAGDFEKIDLTILAVPVATSNLARIRMIGNLISGFFNEGFHVFNNDKLWSVRFG
jgi:hypothetical protein